MELFTKTLKQKGFKGDIDDSIETRELFSHDASLFEVFPKLVVAPKDASDISLLVNTVNAFRATMPHLSLTARSGGTDMSGGAINESIIVNFNAHMNKIERVTSSKAQAQPGVFYRDFEKETFKHNALMPSFPASRELCTIGGMVANNSGGELSLSYGKTERYVTELQVILSDGKDYTIKPLNKQELESKMLQKDFEGKLYRDIFKLTEKNYDQIKAAKPKVTKNSTGYKLWDIWDRETGMFDLTQLIIGSQGTLGLVTDIHFRLVRRQPYSGVLVLFMRDIHNLGEVIAATLTHKPASLESFDNYTLYLSVKFFFYFRKTIGWINLIKLGWSLIPDAMILFRGIPKMIMLAEFTGQSQEEVDQKITAAHQDLKRFKLEAMEEDSTAAKAWKFRIMRRESFNLLRKKVKDKHTAPYIDDFVVPPEHLVEFLPQLRQIINKYKLFATVAGHPGDGNFHVIPLMKIEEPKERAKLQPSMREVNELVLKYGGSLSGEHNDGLIRGPWLEQMYGKEVVSLFREVKYIFDPQGIFNPHKKANADWEYSMRHVREHF